MNARRPSILVILILALGMVQVAITIVPQETRATTHFVGGGGPGNHTTIQQAVDLAGPGDEIFVYGGTYIENVRVLNPLSLIGEDRNTTIIDGGGTGNVLDIRANSVTITGFTITGGGPFGFDSGIDVYGVRDCLIANNNIALNDNYGILFYFSSNSTTASNRFTDSNFAGIHILKSENITLMDNLMDNDGVRISGSLIVEWTSHTIDTSNTVNGKPVRYVKNVTSGTIPTDAGQVILANATNVVVENLNINRASIGILIGFSSQVEISNNNVSLNDAYGILLEHSDHNTLTNNVAYSNERDGIRLERSSGNVIANNEVNLNVDNGIALMFDCHHNYITDNSALNDYEGVVLSSSDNNTVANNTVHAKGNGQSIHFESSENNTIVNNDISTDNWNGIWLVRSDSTSIVGNTIFSPYRMGILVVESDNNLIEGNNILSNIWYGITLSSSVSNTILNNSIEDGIMIAGVHLEEWNTHTIDTSNTIYNKPIYYWKDATEGTVPIGAGQIILANCEDVRVENQAINSTSDAIILGFSSHNSISGNALWWNRLGVYLYESDHNEIFYNNVSSNDIMGLQIDYSSNNTIRNNTLWDNWGQSVYLRDSADNMIYHNNFIDNSKKPYDNTDANEWDDGYPSGGNYWDDYYGLDVMSGPSQDQPGSDGIGDVPYVIDSRNNDTYPLMSPVPFGPPLPSPPSEPRNLQAQAGDQHVILAWEPPESDGGSPVTNYVIYRGGSTGGRVFLEEIGTEPTYTDTVVTNGQTYYYQVSAMNAMGEGGRSSEVSATPTGPPVNQAPACSIIVPVSGETVSGLYTVIGSSSDQDGTISKVEVRIDEGSWVVATGTTSWSYDWDTSIVSNGEHTVRARSFDGTAYSFESHVHMTVSNPPPAGNKPPTSNITSPISGSTVAGICTIEGTSHDSDGVVQRTEIKIDDGPWMLAVGIETWSIAWDTDDVENGDHTIYARGYDGSRYSSIVHVNVIVDNPTSGESEEEWSRFAVIGFAVAVIIIVLISVYLYERRMSRKGEESKEPPPEEPL